MRTRLRQDLTEAMKAGDTVAVAALRSAIAAIDNAEAVDVASDPTSPLGTEHVAGARAGVGSTEAARRVLTEAEVEAIVRAQMDERRAAAKQYAALGDPNRAERLRRESDVLARYLS